MSSGIEELQRFTAVSKYARHVKELGRREVWPETVARYAGMMREAYPARAGLVDEVCKRTEAFEVMPSMRGLQFGGPPVFQHNARLYNCTGHVDRLRFFGEAFYLLLCGSGTGFSSSTGTSSTSPPSRRSGWPASSSPRRSSSRPRHGLRGGPTART
jgi:ribonucleoside-triphosphate reductase